MERLTCSSDEMKGKIDIPSVPQQITFHGIPWCSSIPETMDIVPWNASYHTVRALKSKDLLERYKESYDDDEFGPIPSWGPKVILPPNKTGMWLIVGDDTQIIPSFYNIAVFHYVFLPKDNVLTYDFADTALTSIHLEGTWLDGPNEKALIELLVFLRNTYGRYEEDDISTDSLFDETEKTLYKWVGSNDTVCQLIIGRNPKDKRFSYDLNYAWMKDEELIAKANECAPRSIANYYHKIRNSIF